MQHMASVGEYTGGEAPYGFAVEGERVVEVEAEQAVVREARRLRAEGLSLRAVARELDAAGLRSRTARPFAAVQIQRMLAA